MLQQSMWSHIEVGWGNQTSQTGPGEKRKNRNKESKKISKINHHRKIPTRKKPSQLKFKANNNIQNCDLWEMISRIEVKTDTGTI